MNKTSLWVKGQKGRLNSLNAGRDAVTSTCPIARKGATACPCIVFI
jgi:hypothetical protein